MTSMGESFWGTLDEVAAMQQQFNLSGGGLLSSGSLDGYSLLTPPEVDAYQRLGGLLWDELPPTLPDTDTRADR